MPALPPEHQKLRQLSPITPTNPPRSPGSDPSRPSTWEDSLIRAVQVAAGPEVPPNYDFPFGIPDLLIQTSYDPLWAYHNRPPPVPTLRSAEHKKADHDDVEEAPGGSETERLLARQQAPTGLEQQKEPPLPENVTALKKPIHVLCTNVRASYIAFALSGVSNRAPPGLILPHATRKKYMEEGRRISVLRHNLWNESNDLQPEPYMPEVYEGDGNHIDHLVLTTQACKTGRWLAPILPRIDSRTVLCLIQDGLGVPEHLDATIFRNPATRPRYVLGHMTHLLRHLRKPRDSRDHFRFALGEEEDSGALHLTSYTPCAPDDGFSSFSSEAFSNMGRRPRAESFVYAMWRAPRLNVVNHSLGEFLARKLPTMVFQSVVEPVSALLDCDYSELCRSRVGLGKVEQLLHEVSQVMLSLPELSHEHKFLDYVGSHRLRGDVLGQLRNTDPGTDSEMRWLIRNARPTNIDFLSGWFLDRAKEVGVDVPYLEMTIELVKGKTKIERKRADNLIAFQRVDTRKRGRYY